MSQLYSGANNQKKAFAGLFLLGLRLAHTREWLGSRALLENTMYTPTVVGGGSLTQSESPQSPQGQPGGGAGFGRNHRIVAHPVLHIRRPHTKSGT